MKKKLLALALAATVSVSMSGTAFAENASLHENLTMPIQINATSREDFAKEAPSAATYNEMIKQAFSETLGKRSDPQNLIFVVPDIQKSWQQGNQARILAYVSYGILELRADGKYHMIEYISAPYEIYGLLGAVGSKPKLTYALILPPKVVDAGIWDSLELDEATFDPEMLLKKQIGEKFSPAEQEQAMGFLNQDPDFSVSLWESIVGQELASATPEQISEAMSRKLGRCKLALHNAMIQYADDTGENLVFS